MKTDARDYLTAAALRCLTWAPAAALLILVLPRLDGQGPLWTAAVLAVLSATVPLTGICELLLVRALARWAPLVPGTYGPSNPMWYRWKQHAIGLELGLWLVRPLWQQFSSQGLRRLAGLRVGSDAIISVQAVIEEPTLVEIGAGAVIGNGAIVSGHLLVRGCLRLGQVAIRPRATIGVRSLIFPDVEVGEGATVLPGSVVTSGSRIPPRAVWGGNPARPVRPEAATAAERSDDSGERRLA